MRQREEKTKGQRKNKKETTKIINKRTKKGITKRQGEKRDKTGKRQKQREEQSDRNRGKETINDNPKKGEKRVKPTCFVVGRTIIESEVK